MSAYSEAVDLRPSNKKHQLTLLILFLVALAISLSPFITVPIIGANLAFIIMMVLELFISLYTYNAFYPQKNQLCIINFKKALPFVLIFLFIQMLPLALDRSFEPTLLFSYHDIPGIVFIVIMTPFFEEIFYRGCLFDVVCSLCDSIGAGQGRVAPALITSLFFSVMHTQFFSVYQYISVFILSIVAIRVRAITKGLLFPMMLHAFFNAIFVLAIYK
ncbi:CPBP family intramembrane glutamic endopeptidase [Pseudescherichia sp.]|uniref:CPBP family intramembrane glutamic endopeptidase n=1 Tax=Pseudescherichia sp. TaxID=2055881 RepID=UPI0028B21D07|nr:CPBP family intramembrane glutamic endopeptidase [Pseudescherichia sp.]